MRIEHQRSHDGFCLADDTGQCRILPEGAQIVIKDQHTWKGDARATRRNLISATVCADGCSPSAIVIQRNYYFQGKHCMPWVMSAARAVNTYCQNRMISARLSCPETPNPARSTPPASNAALCLGSGMGAALLLAGLLL